MKMLLIFLLLTSLSEAAVAQAAASAPAPSAPKALVFTGGGSEMRGTELKSCNPEGEICLTVQAENSLGSQVKALQQMTHPRVEYHNKKNNTTERIEGTSGYIDLASNNLVVYVRNGKTLKEIEFNLKTLNRFEQIIR